MLVLPICCWLSRSPIRPVPPALCRVRFCAVVSRLSWNNGSSRFHFAIAWTTSCRGSVTLTSSFCGSRCRPISTNSAASFAHRFLTLFSIIGAIIDESSYPPWRRASLIAAANRESRPITEVCSVMPLAPPSAIRHGCSCEQLTIRLFRVRLLIRAKSLPNPSPVKNLPSSVGPSGFGVGGDQAITRVRLGPRPRRPTPRKSSSGRNGQRGCRTRGSRSGRRTEVERRGPWPRSSARS